MVKDLLSAPRQQAGHQLSARVVKKLSTNCQLRHRCSSPSMACAVESTMGYVPCRWARRILRHLLLLHHVRPVFSFLSVLAATRDGLGLASPAGPSHVCSSPRWALRDAWLLLSDRVVVAFPAKSRGLQMRMRVLQVCLVNTQMGSFAWILGVA
mgnify:FL=1